MECFNLRQTHRQSIHPTATATSSQTPHRCRSTCPADRTPIQCDCDCANSPCSRGSNTWTPCRHSAGVRTTPDCTCRRRRTAFDGVRGVIDANRIVDGGRGAGAVVGRPSDDCRRCGRIQSNRSCDWRRPNRGRRSWWRQDPSWLWPDCRRSRSSDGDDCSCVRRC